MAFTLDREDQSWTAFRMMIRGAGQPLYLFGGCGWEDSHVNRGVDTVILDPTFVPEEGVGCHMMTDVTGASAEEGGDFPVDWQSERVIQAHLPESVAAWRSYNTSRYAKFVALKLADRIVRLNRAQSSDCAELVAKFAPGQPDY